MDIDTFSSLNDTQLQEKIQELNKKLFAARYYGMSEDIKGTLFQYLELAQNVATDRSLQKSYNYMKKELEKEIITDPLEEEKKNQQQHTGEHKRKRKLLPL